MKVILVNSLGTYVGREVDVSELEDRDYDLRVRTARGGCGAANNSNLDEIREFIKSFGHLGSVYVAPSQQSRDVNQKRSSMRHNLSGE